jgi:dTDP-4-dehydrorhamnose 3,5-epimerase
MKKLRILKTKIKDLFLIKHNLFIDKRGSFKRGFCLYELKKKKIYFTVKQANFSENLVKGTLRGFHMQKFPFQEDKLLTCVRGAIYNVVVDMRKRSKTYGKYKAFKLNEKNKFSILIPKGCANAFLTLKKKTLVHYYCSSVYSKYHEIGYKYDDPFFNIKWPEIIKNISKKDLNHKYILS